MAHLIESPSPVLVWIALLQHNTTCCRLIALHAANKVGNAIMWINEDEEEGRENSYKSIHVKLDLMVSH
jgi:hypothetical protein